MKSYIRNIIAIFATLLLFCSVCGAATTENHYQKGCDLYSKNEFRAAAQEFEHAAKNIRSADIYYNLGNCHYRLNDYPRARLAYERAVKIDPSNQDAKYNLKITVAKIKTTGAQSQSFISSWANDFVHSRSISQWAVYAVVLFALMLACVLLYRFANALWLRKGAFFSAGICLFLMIVALVCAGVQTSNDNMPSEAIVIQQSDVMQSPSDNSKALQHILPGAKIKLVRGTSLKGWQQISLGEGQKGWIATKDIGVI